jgi:hypothetical protein
MRGNVIQVLSFCVGILIANAAGAAIVPAISLSNLVEQSDVVVMGTIGRVIDVGQTTVATANNTVLARRMIAEVHVDQILRGPMGLSMIRCQYDVPGSMIGYRGLRSLSYRLLFLKAEGDHFRFVSPFYPSVIATAGTLIEAERPLDRVLEAVAALLRSPNAPSASKREAIDTVWGVKSAVVTEGLRSVLHEEVRTAELRTVQLSAAAALLAVGDVSALPIAEAELLMPDASLPPETLPNLRGGLSHGIFGEAAIPVLARVLSSGDVETRRAASSALRRSGLRSALRPLASSLDDGDIEVSHNAVLGLAEITRQPEWGPSRPAFLQEREKYLAHWKDWVRGY